MDDSVRYPIGQFSAIQELTEAQRKGFIESIADIPVKLRQAVANLGLEQLNTPYRPGGWTLQQIVHHLSDVEMNAYIRFKRGLTEDHPIVPSFRQDLWAELSDYQDTPIETSILLVEALHSRFVRLLKKMEPSHFGRWISTEAYGEMTLDEALQRFAWHAHHHIAQITSLREGMGW